MPVNFSPNRIKLRLCTYRKLNLILINSIYLVFFYLKYSFFKIYFSLKKRKIFKFIKLAKNVLFILFLIDTSCFDEWFLFHVITEKNIAYKGLRWLWSFSRAILKSKCFERRRCFQRSPHLTLPAQWH